MMLDRFIASPPSSQSGVDVFAMEFRNAWEARDAREAADLVAEQDRLRPGYGRPAQGLIAVGRAGAAAVRHLDDVIAEMLRRAPAIGR